MARKIPLLTMAGHPGFVTAWYVAGPFKSGCTDGENVNFLDAKHSKFWEKDLLSKAGGERKCRPKAGAAVRAQGLKRRWQKVEVKYFEWLEVEKLHLKDKDISAWMKKEAKFRWWDAYDSITYAACYIESGTERDVQVFAGGWDGYRLWLNGEFLGEDHSWHHHLLDQDNYIVRLKKGLNLFLMKADRSRVMLRITEVGGLPAKGLSAVFPDGNDKDIILLGGDASTDPVDALRRIAWHHKPKMPAPLHGEKAIRSWQKRFRQEFNKIVLPEGKPKGRVFSRKISSEDAGEYVREKIEIWREGSFSRVPAYLLVPKKKNGAGMVALHGHGNGKSDACGTSGRKFAADYVNHGYGDKLARRGYVTICIDAIGFGERNAAGFDNCNMLHLGANLLGRNLFSYDLYDYMTAVDYLLERRDVDKKRVGCAGVSFGGTSSYMLAAADERISACITSCAVTSCREYLQEIGDGICGSQTFNGIFKYGDISDILALIAPRPLFIEAGKLDYTFSVHFALEAFEKSKQVFGGLKAPEKVGADFFVGGHKFNGEKSLDWIDGWLS